MLEERSGARRPDQVRRGSLPDPPDRQGRLPDHDDARGALPDVRADHAGSATSRSSCAGAGRTSSTTRAAFSHVWRLNPIIAIHFFSLFALLLVYPIADHPRARRVQVLPGARRSTSRSSSFFGLLYRCRDAQAAAARSASARSRSSPLSLLMPVTYALLTPLALFTLDTASWETRNHEDAIPEPVPEPVRDVVSPRSSSASRRMLPRCRRRRRRRGRRRARSHAQLPAA